MKRLLALTVALLLLCAAPIAPGLPRWSGVAETPFSRLTLGAFFVEPSVIYFPLTQSPQFRNRVTFTLAFTVPVILTELVSAGGGGASGIICHGKRVDLAVRVAANPDSYSPIFAAHLVTMPTITQKTTSGTLVAGTLDSAATDGDLFAAVSAIWPTVSGCVTFQ